MMTFHELNTIADLCYNREQIAEQLKNAPKPKAVGDVVLPATIADLSFGQLILLLSSDKEAVFIKNACEIFGIKDCDDEDAIEMWGFLMWLQKQIVNAAKRFEKCQIEPTAEEQMAGAKRMNFGWFGLIDWFAIRMHITHEQAENTCWMNVVKCLEIDTEKQKYERRFRFQQERRMKARKK